MTEAQPETRGYQKHGLTTLKTAVAKLGSRAIDKRTTVGRALAAWRADLVADLGGRESLSTQQRALVELAVKTKLMLDSVDAWLLTQPTLVNKRERALFPVVKERLALSSHLVGVLKELGLERKAKEVPTLSDFMKRRQAPAPIDVPRTAQPIEVPAVVAS